MPRSRPLYSSSALQVAQYVFTRSAAEPTQLVLDGAAFGGELPAGRLLLLPLRDLLLRPQTSPATRDAVWRELIRRAREDRSSWLVAAMGMAMPGLRRAVRGLAAGFRGDRDDLESAVAEGFVTAVYKVDLDDHALCARLVDAGRKAGVKQVFKDADLDGAAWSPFASRAPRPPWGHPDFVLAAAVSAGVLTLDEARLIGVTRLEHLPVKDVADWLGDRPNTVVARRLRAEERLRQAITAGDLEARTDDLVTAVQGAAGRAV
jgi:hypothetical protein